MNAPALTRNDLGRLLRAAKMRHPESLILIRLPDCARYIAFGRHARVLRHVGLDGPDERHPRDRCWFLDDDLALVLRRLIAAEIKVAVYDRDDVVPPLDRVALREFPARLWLEPHGEYVERVRAWDEAYRGPALAVDPAAHIAAKDALILGLAERVAAQSELLARRAEGS